jgi:hypothetical protein
MQTLSIEAASPESAHGLYEALADFSADLRETDDGRRYVDVELRGSDREIVDVLNAIEDYITRRSCGPALVGLDGRKYTIHGR